MSVFLAQEFGNGWCLTAHPRLVQVSMLNVATPAVLLPCINSSCRWTRSNCMALARPWGIPSRWELHSPPWPPGTEVRVVL